MRVAKHWHRYLRKTVESPPLEVFKTQVVMALSNLFCLNLHGQNCWTRDIQRSFQSLPFCDSVKHRGHGSEHSLLKCGYQELQTCWRVTQESGRAAEGSWENVGGCCQGVAGVLWGCKWSGRTIRVPGRLQCGRDLKYWKKDITDVGSGICKNLESWIYCQRR